MSLRRHRLVFAAAAAACAAVVVTSQHTDRQFEVFPPCVEVPRAPFYVYTSYKTPAGEEFDLPGLVIELRGSNCSDYSGLVIDPLGAPPTNRVDATASDTQMVSLSFAQIPSTEGGFFGMVWGRVNVDRSRAAFDFLAERGLQPRMLDGATRFGSFGGGMKTIGRRDVRVDEQSRRYYTSGWYHFSLWTEPLATPATTTTTTTQAPAVTQAPTTTLPPSTTAPKPVTPATNPPPTTQPPTTRPPATTLTPTTTAAVVPEQPTLLPAPETTITPTTAATTTTSSAAPKTTAPPTTASTAVSSTPVTVPVVTTTTVTDTDGGSGPPVGLSLWVLLAVTLTAGVIWMVRRR